jgi:glycosyltransferase involved in cell wall biosynthesis
MFGDGPGHLATGKRILFRMGRGVWKTANETANLQSNWHGILCGSRWLAAESRPWFAGPIVAAPPGIDPRLVPTGTPEPWTVGLLSHHAKFKRTLECLETIAPLKERGLRILSYGPGTHPHIDEFVGRPNFTDLAALYGRCALWLMPSANEGFALPPLEAAACGALPIVSDSSPYDLVEWVRSPLDQFAKAIEFHFGNPDILRARAARAQAETRGFTWERTTDAAERMLAEACA